MFPKQVKGLTVTEEDKAKLRELWDFIEKLQGETQWEPAGPVLDTALAKFEELFTKELNK